MMEKLAQPGEGCRCRGCTPTSFHYSYHHVLVQSCSVRSSWEGRHTPPPISSLPVVFIRITWRDFPHRFPNPPPTWTENLLSPSLCFHHFSYTKEKTHRRQCKMSSSKKSPVEGLCGRCLYVWGPWNSTPHPSHTVYVHTVYLFTQKRGGELKQREGYRGKSSQRWVEKYQHDLLYLQLINSDKHLPQSPLQVIFWWRHFAFGCLYSWLVHETTVYKNSVTWWKYVHIMCILCYTVCVW